MQRTAQLAAAREWAQANSFVAADYPTTRLLELKSGTTVAAIVPALDVAETVGDVVAAIAELRAAGVIDELLVVDGGSSDDTATGAARAGATVLQQDDLLAQFGPARGKGDAMWRALSATTAEIVVFVDGDSHEFGDHFVRGLIGPLLERAELQLVKGAYRRPFSAGAGRRVADGGGRVTELTARPLLNIHFPELAALQQPLSGELAARRSALAEIPFMTGYGIEIQMLIDVYRAHGLGAIAQCDLGERINVHQSLARLGAMATTIMRTVARRIGTSEPDEIELLGYRDGILESVTDSLVERPPLATLAVAQEQATR